MLDSFWKKEKLAVVFTADHGQEMFEHGGFGHAGSTFWNEKVSAEDDLKEDTLTDSVLSRSKSLSWFVFQERRRG